MDSWASLCPDIWAKETGESLALHTHNVLHGLAEEARLRRGLSLIAGEPRLWHRAFWACFFHDFGKAAPGFQAMLHGGPVWGERAEAYPADLGEESLARISAWVNGIPDETMRDLLFWPDSLAPGLIRELGFDRLGVERLCAPRPHDPSLFRSTAAAAVRESLAECRRLAWKLAEQPDHRTAGLLLRGLVMRADHAASSAAPPPGAPPFTGSHSDKWKPSAPYIHQQRCAETTGSLLLRAPTGAGKTESALLWASRQQLTDHQAAALLYLLPFQASLNAMYRRLSAYFPGAVGIQHGRSLHVLYREMSEDGETPANAARRAMLARDLTRLGRFPLRVTTPYQFHTYHPGQAAWLIRLLAFLRERFGTRLCIISATLPAILADAIQAALGPCARVEADPPCAER